MPGKRPSAHVGSGAAASAANGQDYHGIGEFPPRRNTPYDRIVPGADRANGVMGRTP